MLLFAACLVSVDVVTRKLFAVTFTGSDEISGYLFAISTSWAFAYVLLHRGNVRIDALYLLLPRPVCAVLDVIGLLVLGGFMIVFAQRAGIALLTSIEMSARSNTPLQTPTAIPQSLWFAGLLLFLLVWLIVLLRSGLALARGDLATVTRTAGAPSLDEEVDQELRVVGPVSSPPRDDR